MRLSTARSDINRVGRRSACDVRNVRAVVAPIDRVRTIPIRPVEHVEVVATIKLIVALITGNHVVPGSARNQIDATTTGNRIIARTAIRGERGGLS